MRMVAHRSGNDREPRGNLLRAIPHGICRGSYFGYEEREGWEPCFGSTARKGTKKSAPESRASWDGKRRNKVPILPAWSQVMFQKALRAGTFLDRKVHGGSRMVPALPCDLAVSCLLQSQSSARAVPPRLCAG